MRCFSGLSASSRSPRFALISRCAGSGKSSIRGMRGRDGARSGGGGTKFAGISYVSCSLVARSMKSDGFGGVERMVTSPMEADGEMAAETAAVAAWSIAAVLCPACARVPVRSMRSANAALLPIVGEAIFHAFAGRTEAHDRSRSPRRRRGLALEAFIEGRADVMLASGVDSSRIRVAASSTS